MMLFLNIYWVSNSTRIRYHKVHFCYNHAAIENIDTMTVNIIQRILLIFIHIYLNVFIYLSNIMHIFYSFNEFFDIYSLCCNNNFNNINSLYKLILLLLFHISNIKGFKKNFDEQNRQ